MIANYDLDGFDLHDVPLGHPDSFLGFDGVAVLAGAFEEITARQYAPPHVSYPAGDLDRREREFYTLMSQGKPFVFLVQPMQHQLGDHTLPDYSDLFRRVMSRFSIGWELLSDTVANLQSRIPEFRSFVEKHGAASVCFEPSYNYHGGATIIAGSEQAFFGFETRQRVFFLPCHQPQTHDEAVQIAADAFRAITAYSERTSEEIPEWAGEFQFSKETPLREAVAQHRTGILRLETELDAYTKRKGALCYRSEPLVRVVILILESVLGLRIKSEDKCIEDALAVDDNGSTIAVVEIKGVSGNFTRQYVNQVDSHRERLSLPPETPGLLIINTMMTAKSLGDKGEAPHPDIIRKAVQDRVLLVRTLDLLSYADPVESGSVSKDDFRRLVLSESGWLKVEDGVATVVTG